MMLERGQDKVEIADLGELVSAVIFDGDPRTNPFFYHLDRASLGQIERARKENEEEGPVLGFPMMCAVDAPTNTILLWPACARTYWLKARYYPPMKETP